LVEVLNIALVSDVLVFVTSCRGAEIKDLKKDPDLFSKCIDESGYKIIQTIKYQGLSNIIGVMQHLEEVPQNKKQQVKRLFARYFTSEFSEKDKFLTFNSENCMVESETNTILRALAVMFPKSFNYQHHRS
jgi:pre-rRNA-processing protein TSR1